MPFRTSEALIVSRAALLHLSELVHTRAVTILYIEDETLSKMPKNRKGKGGNFQERSAASETHYESIPKLEWALARSPSIDDGQP